MKHKKIIISFSIIIVLLIATYSIKNFAENDHTYIDTKKYESICTTYIDKYGWTHSNTPVEIEEVVIPSEFNETYKNYNILQKKQNFNLEKYQGKTCIRFTYKITNYKNNANYVNANILIYNGKIIGADISSVRLNGFMHEVSDTRNQI